jgi:hypothetical protein
VKQVEKRTYRGHKKIRILMREKKISVVKPAGEAQQRHGFEYENRKTSLINGRLVAST